MREMIIAAGVTPSNTPHGYNFSFAFPMALFIVIAAVVYLLLFRPHKVPGHHDMAYAGGNAPDVNSPELDTARAAAVAGGLPTAAGGGSSESQVEPAGAHLETAAGLEEAAAEEEAAAAADEPADPAKAVAEPAGAARLEAAAQEEEAAAGQADSLSEHDTSASGGSAAAEDTEDS
ncbi:MAG: hypothetical protein ACLQDY_10820 [Streptosporangiaceae bacterium]